LEILVIFVVFSLLRKNKSVVKMIHFFSVF